jgi:hypothetical protein
MEFDVITKAIMTALGIFSKLGEQKRQKIERLEKFLRTLASCLKEMVRELEYNKVPHQAGTRIETAFTEFWSLVEQAGVDENDYNRLIGSYSALEQNLAEGQFLDDVIRGKILDQDATKKTRILSDMLRTSGYLEGIADTLKV